MFALVQDTSGNWHWPSILPIVGWVFAGILLLVGLWVGKVERDKDGPWIISEVQREASSSYLRGTPAGKVAVEYTAADQVRSNAFATILKKMLEDGGYDVWGYMPAFQQTGNVPPIKGIRIGVKSQSAASGEHVLKAFKAIGIDAITAPQNNNNYDDDRAVIYIGIKP